MFKRFLVLLLLFASNMAQAGDINGIITAPMAKYVPNTVVYIVAVEAPAAGWNIPAGTVVNQKGLKFIPHVLPLVMGSEVNFKNSDNYLHNVFSPDKVADRFDLGTYPKDVVKSHTFTKEGVAAILCNVHPEMEAYIVILQNPYYALTQESGAFSIKGLPAGQYELTAWNEKYECDKVSVTVEESGETIVNLQLTK